MLGRNNNTVSTWEWERQRQPAITKYFQKNRTPFGKEKDDLSNYLFFPTDNLTVEDLRQSENKKAKVIVNDQEVAVILHQERDQEKIYAVQEKCPHAGGPLHLGDIEDVPGYGACVKCPYHKYTFSLTTGECIFPAGRDKVEVFPVKVEGRKPIKLGFTSFSSKLFTTPPE